MQPLLRTGPACLLSTDLSVASRGGCYRAFYSIDGFEAATNNSAEPVLNSKNEEAMSKPTVFDGSDYDEVLIPSPFTAALHQMGQADIHDHDKWSALRQLISPLPPAYLMVQLTAGAAERRAFSVDEAVDVMVG